LDAYFDDYGSWDVGASTFYGGGATYSNYPATFGTPAVSTSTATGVVAPANVKIIYTGETTPGVSR